MLLEVELGADIAKTNGTRATGFASALDAQITKDMVAFELGAINRWINVTDAAHGQLSLLALVHVPVHGCLMAQIRRAGEFLTLSWWELLRDHFGLVLF